MNPPSSSSSSAFPRVPVDPGWPGGTAPSSLPSRLVDGANAHALDEDDDDDERDDDPIIVPSRAPPVSSAAHHTSPVEKPASTPTRMIRSLMNTLNLTPTSSSSTSTSTASSNAQQQQQQQRNQPCNPTLGTCVEVCETGSNSVHPNRPVEKDEVATATLWSRLGDIATVTEFITVLLRKCETDPRISRFFDGRSMTHLRRKQIAFASAILGGPHRYSGKGINDAHRALVERYGLREEHFNAFGELIYESLREVGVEESLAREVRGEYDKWEDCVLSKGEWGR